MAATPDEDFDFALALSLSEAEAKGNTTTSSTYFQPVDPTAGDAALARILQDELNRETHHQQRAHPSRADSQSASLPDPPPLQPQWNATPQVGDSTCCAGCNQPLVPSDRGLLGFVLRPTTHVRYLSALGRHWHPQCFRCTGCRQPLSSGGGGGGGGGGMKFALSDSGEPYHEACHQHRFHPRCSVCSDHLPKTPQGQIIWQETPFWKAKSCPKHATDGTKRCTSCTRLNPRGETWTQLDDGRSACPACASTAVEDTIACQPLYQDILQFYSNQGMPLPSRPPLVLVDDTALNDAGQRETDRLGGRPRPDGPVQHTRGLCLAEYTQIVHETTVATILGGKHKEVILGPAQCHVTALLVLRGLPRILTGSILAHEVMHAWLRMHGYRDLDAQVEEGLCQLMALLWLEAQPGRQNSASADTNEHHRDGGGVLGASNYRDGGGGVEFEDKLAAFLGHQIRSDTSVVYGDGLRAAHDVFQRHGLKTVLAHVKVAGKFPS